MDSSFEIAAFADGNTAIGLGHLTRLRSLIGRLNKPATVVSRTPEFARHVFSDRPACRVVPLKNGAADEMASVLAEHAPAAQLVLFDPPIIRDEPSAASGPAWQPSVDALRHAGRKVVRLTDEATPTAHRCDLLVNDHPDAADFVDQYSQSEPSMRVRGGLQYFLIDRSHLEVDRKASGRLFVSFGGGDQSDLVPRFTDALAALTKEIEVDLVVGAASDADVMPIERLHIHRALTPERFAALLAGAKMALTAAGNTMFERVFHRIPGISLAQFEHQESFGRAFQSKGLSLHLGPGREIDPPLLIESVRAFLRDDGIRERQIAAAATVDLHQGSEKLLNDIQEMTAV